MDSIVGSEHHTILLVEDNPEDHEITVRALTRAGLANPIYHCAEGDDALDYLHRRKKYSDLRSPPYSNVILLDLNPSGNGRPRSSSRHQIGS